MYILIQPYQHELDDFSVRVEKKSESCVSVLVTSPHGPVALSIIIVCNMFRQESKKNTLRNQAVSQLELRLQLFESWH